MTNPQRQKRLEAEKLRMQKKYGGLSADFASTKYDLNVIPSGILALDYALGIGGIPRRHPVEIFGAPDVGKSSALGASILSNAQKMGLTCGIVGLEPGVDGDWLEKLGIDPEWVIIGRPDDGYQAFEMTHDWLRGDLVDVVLFDSVGALLRPSEVEDGGKPSQGGQSNLITWGTKACLMPCWKNNKGLIFLNQVRDDMNSRITGLVESPGGWALKHGAAIRIHLKNGREKWTVKENSEDVIVGRQLVAHIKRNKLAEGTGRKASFNFFQQESEYGFGIDQAEDVLNTAMRTGVIEKAGAWYRHETFPEAKSGGRQLQGKAGVAEFLAQNPEVGERLRLDVLEVMRAKAKIKDYVPDPDALDEEDSDNEE